jgi:hypothetical protein
MTLKILLASITLAAVGAGTAQAFELSGAQVTLEYRDNGGTGHSDQLQAEGSVALSFGYGIGMQFGIKNAVYKPGNFDAFGYELHGTYALSDQLMLGAFYGREDFSGWYEYAGIEADYSVGQFGVQASASKYQDTVSGGYDADFVTLDGRYVVTDRVSVLAGYHHGDDGSGSDSFGYIGASARVFEGVDVTARYGELNVGSNSDPVVTLGISYSFKDGVTFAQRSYTNMFPTD